MKTMVKTSVWVILAWLMMGISAQAADFAWMNSKGESHTFVEAYQGQPVLVHFWASWCPPCVAEMPEMTAWLEKHPEVKILPVSLDRTLEDAQTFLNEQHIPLRALLTNSSQAARMGVRGLPTSILVRADGTIQGAYVGQQDWQYQPWQDEVLGLFTPKVQ